MAFDYFKAKQAGYSDEEIAQYLAEQKGLDYQSATQSGYQPLEIIGNLAYDINVDKPLSGWEGFTRGVERGVTGTARGIGQVMEKVSGMERTAPPEDIQYDPMGNVISGGTAPSVQEQRTGKSTKFEDERKELEYEIAKAQGNKFATMGGYAVGTILDPANLVGGLGAATVRNLAIEGAVAGTVQGFFDPIYEQADTMATRGINAAIGGTGGAALGAGAGALLRKFGLIEQAPTQVGKAADEAAPPVMDTKSVEAELNKPISPAAIEIPTPKPEIAEIPQVVSTPQTAPVTGAVNQAVPTPAENVPEAVQQAIPQQPIAIQPVNLVAPTAPFRGTATNILGESIDPTSRAWNLLDNPSKNMYNIGRAFLEADATKSVPKINLKTWAEASQVVKTIDNTLNDKAVADVLRSYAKVTDDLYKVKGADFQPPSLPKLLRDGIDDEDMLELMAKGVFDGCNL